MIRAFAAQLRMALRRRTADELLRALSAPRAGPVARTVLVDGVWDNPNFWVRYAVVRAALGLAASHEVGITGPYNAARTARTLRRLGVSEVQPFLGLANRRAENRRLAREIVAETRAPEDVLGWKLPHEVPAGFVYDGILKRQRRGVVDVRDTRLAGFLAEALDCGTAAERLLDRYQFDLLVVSHQSNFLHTALVWLALKRRIPVLMIWGIYGSQRFTKLRAIEDLWKCADVPSRQDLDAVPEPKRQRLERLGHEYLAHRLGGRTSDSAAVKAYADRSVRLDRLAVARAFGWDPRRPIVAVYASSWFDFPHSYGLNNFRDFQDWIELTAEAARANRDVQWLFKRHPWEDNYGGVTLRDILPNIEASPHMRFVPDDWNGGALAGYVDGLVALHGTAGIEFAASGRAVLLADQGWYDHAGFARLATSRADYLDALARPWWNDLDLDATARRARLFAGFHFGHPDWQPPFLLADDYVQWKIYDTLPDFLARAAPVIERELTLVRDWYTSPSKGYHAYKMQAVDDYAC